MQKLKKILIYGGVFFFGMFVGLGNSDQTVIEKPVEKIIEKTVEVPVEKIVEVNNENCDKALHNLDICSQILKISGEVTQKCPEAINAVIMGNNQEVKNITKFVTESNEKMNELSAKIQK